MGCLESNSLQEKIDNINKEENKKLENNDIRGDIFNHEIIKKGESISLGNNILLCEKAQSSICKIIIDNKIGNGFFCKFKYHNNNIIYLVTCYHVINKQILEFYEEIELIFSGVSKKLNLKEKRNTWFNEELDFIAIEIKNEDNIKVNTFEINDNCYNYEYDNNEYNSRGIIIPCFGDNNEIVLPYGAIINSNNEKLMHNCNTKYGNSGAPIIL